MGTIKDRNGMDRTEAVYIKKRWQDYMEELLKKKKKKKKGLNDPNSHNGVITHLETGYLKCEVKWALGSIMMKKASGDDGIPADLFQVVNTAPPINRKLD